MTRLKPDFFHQLLLKLTAPHQQHAELDLKGVDLETFFQVARRHGVAPICAQNLLEKVKHLLNAHQQQQCIILLAEYSLKAERQAAQTCHLAARLEEQNIPVIPFKGQPFAAAYLGGAELRSCQDIDLLVQPENVLAARHLLIEEGYKDCWKLNDNQTSAMVRYQKNTAFRHPEHGLLELHWSGSRSAMEFPATKELWKGQGWTFLREHRLRSFSPEDYFLYLCAHARQHDWLKLRYVHDLAAVATNAELDWNYIQTKAQENDRAYLLSDALSMLSACYALPGLPPADDQNRLTANWNTLWSGKLPPSNTFRPIANKSDYRQIQVETLIQPTILDCSCISLPRPLWSGYILIRLIRLMLRPLKRKSSLHQPQPVSQPTQPPPE